MSDESSLIQQRLVIDRQRTLGLVIVVGAGLALGFSILTLLDHPDNVFRWFGVVLFAVWLVFGIYRLLRAVGRQRGFEEQHGRDAGRQKPVGH